MPAVSIITPLYNGEKTIADCIESVLAQDFISWEMLIIDDGSSDNSIQIVKKYSADTRIKLLKNDGNLGVGLSRNKAIEVATGRYIAFLDCDDYWHPEKLQKQLQFMQQAKIAFSYTAYTPVNEDKTPYNYVITAPKQLDFKTLCRNNYIGCLTVVYDSKLLGKQFFPAIRRRQDWVLWLNILKQTDGFALDESLAFYRIATGSLSSNKFKLLKDNYLVYKNQLGQSTLQSFVSMGWFLVYHFAFKYKTGRRYH